LLEQNLIALRARQPALADAVARATSMTLNHAHNGEPTCSFQVGDHTRRLHSAYDPGNEGRRLAACVPDGCTSVRLVGGGLGYTLAALAERAGLVVEVLEPQLELTRAMLSLFDLTPLLRTRRLTLLSGSTHDENVLSGDTQGAFELRHPAMGNRYDDAARHLRFSARSSAAQHRVIVVHNKLFVADLAQLLEQNDYAVRIVHPTDLSVASFEALCTQVDPRFVLSVNFSPELALLSSRANLLYVSWTIDPLPASRLRLMPGTNTSTCLAFAHRRALVAALRTRGLQHVHYLPLAASPMRHPMDDDATLDPWRCDISFAGNSLSADRDSLMRYVEQHGGNEALQQRLVTWLQTHFDAEVHASNHHGLALDGSELPPWLPAALASADPEELSDRINEGFSQTLRFDRLRALSGYDVRVYGDDGWEVFGTSYRGRVAHGEDLTKLYNASAISLDVPRTYQRDIVTMRVFDVMACGGVVLTEPSEQLGEMFNDGEHVVTYSDRTSLRTAVDGLLADPTRRAAVASAGRRLVEREHQMQHRLARILAAVERMQAIA